MPEATGTTSTAPAAASSGQQTAGSAAANTSSQATTAGQTSNVKQNLVAAAQAALDGKGRDAVRAALASTPSGDPTLPSARDTAEEEDPTFGFNPAQVQALKRAQLFDPDIIKSIPPSNRKAWADKWAAKLSANDREFQKSRQQKSGDQQAKLGDMQEDQQAAGDTADAQNAQQDGQPSQANEPVAFTPQAMTQAVLKAIEPDAEETETLVDQFGEDGVTAIRAREARLAQAVVTQQMQAVQPIMQAVMQLADLVFDAEFESAVSALRQQPGYEKVDTSDESLAALRNAAIAHVRANGGRLRDAVPIAAQQVFKIDPRLAAQASLARVANPMLATSGARPSNLPASPRPTTTKEKQVEAMRALMAGRGTQAALEILNG